MRQFHVLLIALLVSSCKEEPVTPINPAPPGGVTGVYVLNEGAFGDPSGARLTLYDPSNDSVYKDVVESANGGAHLGSLGDDMTIHGGLLYCVMSGSEKLTRVNLADHRIASSRSYSGDTPHDIVIDGQRNRAYLTRLFKGSILLVDLTTLEVIDSIGVGNNPQGMALAGSRLVVCNSGFGANNTVSVVDVAIDSVVVTAGIGDGPSDVVIAPDGRAWIACTGNAFGSPPTLGSIHILDVATGRVEDTISFSENLWGRIALGVDPYVYVIGVTSGSFSGGPVHRVHRATGAIEMNFIPGTFYSMEVEGASGDIYLGDALNFGGDGRVEVFSSQGQFKKRFAAQLGPGAFVFN